MTFITGEDQGFSAVDFALICIDRINAFPEPIRSIKYIADLLAGINDDPPAAPKKKRKRRKKKASAATAGAGEL